MEKDFINDKCNQALLLDPNASYFLQCVEFIFAKRFQNSSGKFAGKICMRYAATCRAGNISLFLSKVKFSRV